MYPEYLINNDTQDVCRRVSELVKSNEPALREYCLEVSRQTDTSSLTLKEECEAKVKEINASFAAMTRILEEMSQSLFDGGNIFETQNVQSKFPTVCRAIIQFEEHRHCLLSYITELTKLRRILASNVADANRVLHFLSVARRAVPEELHNYYAEAIERVEGSYARLTKADGAVGAAQDFYITLIERHLPVFMERLRAAADFNHAGAELDRVAIRALCKELLLLQNRVPNVFF
jgi:hypothetical protein